MGHFIELTMVVKESQEADPLFLINTDDIEIALSNNDGKTVVVMKQEYRSEKVK